MNKEYNKVLAEHFKSEYEIKEKTEIENDIDMLKSLDKSVKNPARIFGYTFGSIGSLVLGTGMCLAMKVIGGTTPLMIAGILIGLLGIAMVSVTYPIYKTILNKRKKKYSKQIIDLSNKISNLENYQSEQNNI